MALNIAPDVVSTIVGAVVYRTDGATLGEIVAAFPEAPERAQVQRWLTDLVAARILGVDTVAGRRRYFARTEAAAYVRAGNDASPAAPAAAVVADTSAAVEPGKLEVPQRAKTDLLTERSTGAVGGTSAFAEPTADREVPAPGTRSAAEAAVRGQGRGTERAVSGTRSGTEVPAPRGAEVAAPRTPTVPAGEDMTARFARLFEGELRGLVGEPRSREATTQALRQRATQMTADPAEQQAWVRYAEDRLKHLTLGECARLQVPAPQYELWRRAYSAPAPSAGPQGGRLETAEAIQDADIARERATDESPAEAAEKPRAGRRTKAAEASPQTDLAKVITPLLEAAVKEATAARPGAAVPGAAAPAATAFVAALAKPLAAWIGRSLTSKRASAGVIATVVVAVAAAVVMQSLGASVIVAVAVGALVFAAGAIGLGNVTANVAGQAAATGPGKGAASGAKASMQVAPDVAAPAGQNPGANWRRIGLSAGLLVAALAAVIFTWHQQVVSRPSVAAVTAYLTTSLSPLPVRIAALDLTFQGKSQAGTRVSYRAVVETTEPLYRRLDAREYLRAHYGPQLSPIDAANALLRGPSGSRLRTALSAPPPAPGVDELTLLTTQTMPGATAPLSGALVAWRRDGAWTFMPEFGTTPPPRFAGESKPLLAGAFAVDSTTDAARLKSLIEDHVAYATKVRTAADALAAELERDRQQKVEAFGQLLSPGTLFTGTYTDVYRERTTPVVWEVATASAAAHRLTAVLRNDGGWMDTRTARGEWSPAADGETCMLTLTTRTGDAVEDGGPLLQNLGDNTLAFELRADGTATSTSMGRWELHRVEPASAAVVKSSLMAPIGPALEATAAGKVYRGTATRRTGSAAQTTYPVRLRFTEQTADGVVIRATLESLAGDAAVRRFTGSIIGNTYRAADRPIRLVSRDSERAAAADPKSPLGFDTTHNGFAVSLRPDGPRLVGEDRWFTYVFEPGDAAAADALEPGHQSRPDAPNARPETAGSKTFSAATAVAGSSSLPTYPSAPGAYVLSDSLWRPLPGKNVQTLRVAAAAVRSVTGLLGKLNIVTDSTTQRRVDAAQDVLLNLTFDSPAPVPAGPAGNLVIVYVGAPAAAASLQPSRPTPPASTPSLELAPAQTLPNGARTIPLVEIAPGLAGFGAARVAATLEQPTPDITVLRPTAAIPRGRYVVLAGGRGYEVGVE